MKTWIVTLIGAATLISGIGSCSELAEFALSELDVTTMESFKKGELEGILRIEKGEKLPFTISVEGSVIALPETPQPFLIEALQKVYIKIQKENYLFSVDKIHWKPFEEQFGGEIGVSTEVNDEKEHFGNFYIKLHLK